MIYDEDKIPKDTETGIPLLKRKKSLRLKIKNWNSQYWIKPIPFLISIGAILTAILSSYYTILL